MSAKNLFDAKQNGNMFYITAITLTATLGGLLFGYDTAVISRAEKSVQAFLIESQGLSTLIHGLTISSALIGNVTFITGICFIVFT